MLKVRNLEVFYNGYPTLSGLNFSLARGEAMGIVGRSGAGKTTLLKTLVRFLPANTTVRGEIYYHEMNIYNLPEDKFIQLRGKVFSVLPQNAQASLNPFLKIKTIIAEGARRHKDFNRKNSLKEAERLLNLVELDSCWGEYYQSQLSGGMRTRACLAALLACGSDYLLLDEPTNGLDIIAQEKLAELLLKIKNKEKVGLLIVSHELPFIWKACDRIMMLDDGKIVEEIEKNGTGFQSRSARTFLNALNKIT